MTYPNLGEHMLDADAALRQRAFLRVTRRRNLRQKTLGFAAAAAAGAILSGLVGWRAGSLWLGLVFLLISTTSFLLVYLIHFLLYRQAERRDTWLNAEIERELDHLRAALPKLKRSTFYRLGEDGELETVEKAVFTADVVQATSERR
jgi:fatty acid desaturase